MDIPDTYNYQHTQTTYVTAITISQATTQNHTRTERFRHTNLSHWFLITNKLVTPEWFHRRPTNYVKLRTRTHLMTGMADWVIFVLLLNIHI